MKEPRREMKKRLTGERGIAMLEFGLMLPLFLTLIAGVIETPRMFFVSLRSLNAARVYADLLSRNDNDNKYDKSVKETVAPLLLGDLPKDSRLKLKLRSTLRKTSINEKMEEFASSFLGKITSLISGIVTLGGEDRLLAKPLSMDWFAGGEAEISVPTILPASFLQHYALARTKGVEKFTAPACYMPNRSGYVKSRRTVVEQLKGILKL